MKYIKYCENKFNINVSNTLQFGTFEYYSEMDKSFSIADVNEGWLIFSGFDNKNSLHGDYILNAVQPNGIIDGVTLDVAPSSAIGGVAVTPKFKFRNCYMFCMSVINDGEEEAPEKIDEKYDSFYKIPPEKLQVFIHSIASELLKQLKHDDIEFEKIGNVGVVEFSQHPINVTCWSGVVEYKKLIPEDINKIISENDAIGYENIFKNAIFSKEYKYTINREFRIVFVLHRDGVGVIPVKKIPKLINIKPILQFLD